MNIEDHTAVRKFQCCDAANRRAHGNGNELQAWHRCPPRQSQWLPPLQPQHQGRRTFECIRQRMNSSRPPTNVREFKSAASAAPTRSQPAARCRDTQSNSGQTSTVADHVADFDGILQERGAAPDQTGPSAKGRLLRRNIMIIYSSYACESRMKDQFI